MSEKPDNAQNSNVYTLVLAEKYNFPRVSGVTWDEMEILVTGTLVKFAVFFHLRHLGNEAYQPPACLYVFSAGCMPHSLYTGVLSEKNALSKQDLCIA